MAALNLEILKDTRRGILWCLKVVSGHKLNEHVIRRELVRGGYDLTQASVRDHLHYLAEKDKGYIELFYNREADMYLAEITGKGRDLVDDLITDPGVANGE